MTSHRSLMALGALLLIIACSDAPMPTAPQLPPITNTDDVKSGWIFGPGDYPIEVRYEEISGRAVLEGDIDLGPAGSVPETREELLSRRQPELPEGPRFGVVINGSGYRWQNGVVPYVISGSFSQSQQQVILDAMAHIKNKTAGTSFVARTNQSSYITFSPDDSLCSSPVGRQGGAQTIKLRSNCASVMGIVAHEIGHALGMWHEHSRCDRDDFVAINLNNIQSTKEHNFEKKCSPGSTDGFAYSEASVMHYDTLAFCNPSNCLPTISSLRGLGHLMGQRDSIVASDVNTINWLNSPYPINPVSISYPSGTPTLSWNARPGATSYTAILVISYVECDDYGGGGCTVDDWDQVNIGSTTSTSLVDTQHSYTGNNLCWIWYSEYGSASYVYKYEVHAVYPSPVVGQTPMRWPANIAVC